jgi:hypothetical protein
MSDAVASHGFRPYQAPRTDRTALIDPPLRKVPALLAQNRQSFQSVATLAGHDWTAWRREGRLELLRMALDYTRAYRDVSGSPLETSNLRTVARGPGQPRDRGSSDEPPILLAGHQPELFHPGVWFKNFLLSSLGSDCRAISINLIVDNDLSRLQTIRAPARSEQGEVRASLIELDVPSGGRPIEETRLIDRQLFESFGERLRRQVEPLVKTPIIEQLWPLARSAQQRGVDRLGWILAEARHRYEATCGLQTLEVPLSQLCDTQSFYQFLLAVCSDAPHFQHCYHEALAVYRVAHRIRSRSHPVPNLGSVHDWFEVPFWTYADQDPRRRAVWVQRRGKRLVLSDRVRWEAELPSESNAAGFLEAVRGSGQRLRPRALVTTAYARLVLSDAFIHGIGGGKYDQLNDLIIASFFGIEPPGFLVATATMRLPGAPDPSTARQDLARIEHQLRYIQFAPERLWMDLGVPMPSAARPIVDQKQALLRAIPVRSQKHGWHAEIMELNRAIAMEARPVIAELHERQRAVRSELQSAIAWSNREYAFCCYPTSLPDALTQALAMAVESAGERRA